MAGQDGLPKDGTAELRSQEDEEEHAQATREGSEPQAEEQIPQGLSVGRDMGAQGICRGQCGSSRSRGAGPASCACDPRAT